MRDCSRRFGPLAGRPGCRARKWGCNCLGGIANLDLAFKGRCPSQTDPLQALSHLFDDFDLGYRMYLTVTTGATQGTAILSAGNPSFVVTPSASSLSGFFRDYFSAGILHLAGGFDHEVF